MKDNSIWRAVREGRAALGTGLKEFASRGVPWIIEASGFDYCMIDHEHGAFDLETIADLAGWFQATDVSAIVRIHKSFTHLIPAILDQGIMGIQVSEVDSVEEARAIVREAKYPPIGHRGISGQGMHTGYRSYGARHATEYAPWANANIIVCVSIESLEGLENVEAIAAVEGIDMIAYGHSDLSARLGVHLQLEHPTFKAAVRRIAEACNAHGKLARGSAETEAQIEEYWRLGCKVLNLPGTDVSTYLDGLKARAGRAHARLKSIGVRRLRRDEFISRPAPRKARRSEETMVDGASKVLDCAAGRLGSRSNRPRSRLRPGSRRRSPCAIRRRRGTGRRWRCPPAGRRRTGIVRLCCRCRRSESGCRL